MERQEIHPRYLRIAHWINAVVMLVLLWSGFSIFATDRSFSMFAHLVPSMLLNALQLTGHRIEGRAWHLGMAILFMANAVFYAAASLASGTWRRLVPKRTWLRDAWKATIEEITAPRESLQRSDYNGAQRLAYILVMAAAGVMVMTGLALWFGRHFPWMLAIFGGFRIALVIHVVLAFALLAFILVHLVQVLRAGLPTLLVMITGTFVNRPERARRALAWAAGVTLCIVAAFAILNFTSGPTGIPSVLRWAVPSHGDHRDGLARVGHRER